tara:strand:- start:354 stop:551 length:198 start_codon:yes stop_codon:yes gene_type:complete
MEERMEIMKLIKAIGILLMVWTQGLIIYLNLNQYRGFSEFVELEWYKENRKEKPIQDPYEPDLFV